jgi:hypothetical protein
VLTCWDVVASTSRTVRPYQVHLIDLLVLVRLFAMELSTFIGNLSALSFHNFFFHSSQDIVSVSKFYGLKNY